jgi:hypothetical protein
MDSPQVPNVPESATHFYGLWLTITHENLRDWPRIVAEFKAASKTSEEITVHIGDQTRHFTCQEFLERLGFADPQ